MADEKPKWGDAWGDDVAVYMNADGSSYAEVDSEWLAKHDARIRADERAACVAKLRALADGRNPNGRLDDDGIAWGEREYRDAGAYEALHGAAEYLSATDGRMAVLLTEEEARLVRALVDEHAAFAEQTERCQGGPMLRALAARFGKEAGRG